MQVCEVIYGCERGAALQSFLESAMGQACPCKQGNPCPLMPKQRVDGDAAPVMA